MVQQLKLLAPKAGGPGSILGQGSRPPHAATKNSNADFKTQHSLRNNIKNKNNVARVQSDANKAGAGTDWICRYSYAVS